MGTPDHIISRYFGAMRRGPEAEADLLALFAADAVYDEPFTAPGSPAVGREAIAHRFRQGWQSPLPDMELDVLSVEVDGNVAVSRWECRSAVFAQPVRGSDEYRFRDGLIVSLRVTLDK